MCNVDPRGKEKQALVERTLVGRRNHVVSDNLCSLALTDYFPLYPTPQCRWLRFHLRYDGLVDARYACVPGDAGSRTGRTRRSCGSRSAANLRRLSVLALHSRHGQRSPTLETARTTGWDASIN